MTVTNETTAEKRGGVLSVTVLKGERLRRAALLSGAIGGDPIAGLCRAYCGRLCSIASARQHRRSGQRMRHNERSMTKRRVRALFRNDVETRRNAAHLRGHRALVFATAAAAGWELRIVRSGGERGRNQRQAEDRHQHSCERASHGFHRSRGPGGVRKRATPFQAGMALGRGREVLLDNRPNIVLFAVEAEVMRL